MTIEAFSLNVQPPFDDDGDGDVDIADYPGFAACLEGPDRDVLPSCIRHDGDRDGDVDLEDLAEFQSALAAP